MCTWPWGGTWEGSQQACSHSPHHHVPPRPPRECMSPCLSLDTASKLASVSVLSIPSSSGFHCSRGEVKYSHCLFETCLLCGFFSYEPLSGFIDYNLRKCICFYLCWNPQPFLGWRLGVSLAGCEKACSRLFPILSCSVPHLPFLSVAPCPACLPHSSLRFHSAGLQVDRDPCSCRRKCRSSPAKGLGPGTRSKPSAKPANPDLTARGLAHTA